MNRPPIIICRVCRRALDSYIDESGSRWIHTFADMGADHNPEPVPAPPGWRGRCDFCSVDGATHALPAKVFLVPGSQTHGSTGDWGACPDCAALIEADNWRGVLARQVVQFRKRHGFGMPVEMRAAVHGLYMRLRDNVTGPIRPIEDESGPDADSDTGPPAQSS